MKKVLCFILTLVLVISITALPALAEEPDIESHAAILIDAKTGQILYAKNPDERLYPASITKIMTVYLGVQDQSKMDKLYSASEEAIDAVPRDSSNIALDYGEKLTLKDALYAAMLMSANDACNLIGEAVSGSVDNFVSLMNQTAKTFGARNTNFANTNGLTDENHYTTAYDFALITKEALKNDAFKKVFGTVDYTIGPTNKNDEERNFVSKHRMMHLAKYSSLGVEGGKNGYTSDSLYTLVTYGVKDDKELICVILKCPVFASSYDDTRKLLEYGYNDFNYETLTAEDIGKHVDGLTTYTPEGELRFLLNNKLDKNTLVKTYLQDVVQIKSPDGTVLGELPVTVKTRMSVWQIIWLIIKILFLILISAFIFFYILLILSSRKNSSKRKRKK